MLTQGIIPRALHGIIEYLAAVALIAAPFVLDFDSGAATAVSIVAGVVVLLVAASTEGPTSLANSIPLTAHVALDYVLGAVLIAVPFVFAFTDEGAPTAFFIALGVLHLVVTVGTRFRGPEPAPEPADFVLRDDDAPRDQA